MRWRSRRTPAERCRTSLLPSDLDREPRRAGLEEGRDVLVDEPLRQPDRLAREALEKGGDPEAGDSTGQRRARAEVRSVPERQVVGEIGRASCRERGGGWVVAAA